MLAHEADPRSTPPEDTRQDETTKEPRVASAKEPTACPPLVDATADDHAGALREAAAQAAALGYQVLALHGVDANGACTCRKGSTCEKAGKHPRGRGWQRRPATLERFRQDAAGQTAFNLGLRLDADAALPLVLLDVDTKHGKPGPASFAQLETECGPLPEGALLQTTPSGGRHYVLRVPVGLDPQTLPNATDVLPGLDVFTDGRQFLVSPSRTAIGAYAFVDPARGLPARADLPVVPAAWVERLRALAPGKRARQAATSTQTPDVAPNPQWVVQLLELLPAPADNTRDDAVNFALALHGALAHAEPGVLAAAEAAYLRWAARWPGAVPENDQLIWDSTLGAKQRGWWHVLNDAKRFLDRARAETTDEDAGLVDGADVERAFALLETIRNEGAQNAFEVLEANPRLSRGSSPSPAIVVKSFAEVQPAPIEWLLEGRVARQQITMVNGWPGEGKTSVVIDIAARLTKGDALPDGTRSPAPLRVLFLSTEDSESILHLRLRAAGADMDRVLTIPDTQLQHLTLPSHKEKWLQVLKEHAIDVLVVDPMKSFLDDDLKDIAEQDARKFMLALRQICEAARAAAICIRHPSKATAAGHATAVSAASGSLGFTAAARIELLVGRTPNDEETRALVHVKNNLAKAPPALLYKIVSKLVPFDEAFTQDVAGIEWKGVDHQLLADELLARRENHEERSKLEEAKDFLRNYLAAGPAEHTTVRAAATRHGIAKRTLERARRQAGWTAIVGNLKTGGRTIWGLAGQSVDDFEEAPEHLPIAETAEPVESEGKRTRRVRSKSSTQKKRAPAERSRQRRRAVARA